jgi:hypothetical protein
MNIPIKKGFLIISYHRLIRLLGEPNNGSLKMNNMIKIEWDFDIYGYKLYIKDADEISQKCEWYIGNKDIAWLFGRKNIDIMDNINNINLNKNYSYNNDNSKSYLNAETTIKSLIYYSD